MSCISKILEVKGDKKILISGEIAIEGGGIYKDYEYLITFTSHGHRCGYVAIPETHTTYISNEDYPDFDVHGGITFFGNPRFDDITGHKCTDKWIGFDACHYRDLDNIETAEKYFGETNYINFMKYNYVKYNDDPRKHRSYSYMERECKRLINQLIERSK
jgi:hypothetical protein